MNYQNHDLCSIGIPKDSVVKYETAIKTDKFAVLVPGLPPNGAQRGEIRIGYH